MSLSKQTLTRLPKIKAGLVKRLNREQIGAQCRVTEKTIDRDIRKWVTTDDFERWLKELWLAEYYKIDDVEVFRAVTKLLAKMITQKIEAKAEITERLEASIRLEVTEDEDSILNRAASILDKRLSGKKQPAKIH